LRKAADELFGEMCLWLKPGANVRSWGMERSVQTGAWANRWRSVQPDYEHDRQAFLKSLKIHVDPYADRFDLAA
jgi:hypothetical protein